MWVCKIHVLYRYTTHCCDCNFQGHAEDDLDEEALLAGDDEDEEDEESRSWRRWQWGREGGTTRIIEHSTLYHYFYRISIV